MLERFYRLDQSRSTPGHGLGLCIVAAITSLHGGTLSLEDAAPGLVARMALLRIDAVHGPPATAVAEPERRGSARGPRARALRRGWVRRMTQVVPGGRRRSGVDPGEDG